MDGVNSPGTTRAADVFPIAQSDLDNGACVSRASLYFWRKPCSSVSTHRITVETLRMVGALAHLLLCEPSEGAGLPVCEAPRRAVNRLWG